MSGDIFNTWPEFLSDIPVYNSIPTSLSLGAPIERPALLNDNCIAARPCRSSSNRIPHTIEGVSEVIDEHGSQDTSSTPTDSQIFALPAENDFQFYTDFTDILLLPTTI
jgi:hypothetical protein